MVTFLVCLVVVGGASILILRVTLEDVFQGATGDVASGGGRQRRSLSSRVNGFLAPRRAAGSHPDGTDPAPGSTASVAPGAPAVHVQLAPGAGATYAGVAPSAPTLPAVPGSGGGPSEGDVVDQPVAWRGDLPTSSVLLEERTTEVRTTEVQVTEAAEPEPEPEPEPRPQVAAPPPARDRPAPVAPREPLPPLRRRLLRRLAGAVKLLVLLVLVGSVLALLLGAAALLFAYAMRAAIGA